MTFELAFIQTRACWKTTIGLIGTAIPFKLVNDASQFVAPIFINLLLGVVDNRESSGKGYTLAVLMFVGLMLGTICDNQHFQYTMRAGKVSLFSGPLFLISTPQLHCH